MRILFVLLIALSGNLFAQNMDPGILSKIKELSEKYHSDAVIIKQNGQVIYEDYFGQKDVPRYISSAGKSIASLAIGKLLELGLLDSLDQPVCTFFPEWKQGQKQKITIRMLLNHSSGLQNLPNASIELEPAPDYTVDDIIQLALCAELSHDPGTHFSYNNKAAALIGGIVEKASGMPFDLFMVEHFYKKMDISNYAWIKDRSDQATTHGAFLLSAKDFLKFGELMLHKGKYKGNTILPESWIRQSVLPSSDLYKKCGLLWWLLPSYHKRIIDQDIVEQWKKSQVSPEFISHMSPLLNKEFPTNEDFYQALQQHLGSNYRQELGKYLDQDLPWAKHDISDEIIGYYADGYRGNWLVVIPKYKLVAVRTADHEGHDAANGDNFTEFLELIKKLYE